MHRSSLLGGLVLVTFIGFAQAENKPVLPAAPTNAGMEKLKSLVGTWVKADDQGRPTDEIVSVMKLTAGGSALQETLFPGQPHEMISMYTAEGTDVVMTHYCMLGNQPRMKANTKSPGNKLRFEFNGGSNLDPKKDKHMHSATLTIMDADHIMIEGEAWENGVAAKESCGCMTLVRKK